MAQTKHEIKYINKSGERVTHLYPNDCYYAHLSIYRFASQFCQAGEALDAGSGAGYGAAYLIDQGAKYVYGVDVDLDAVAFSRKHFTNSNLDFRVLDLGLMTGFSSHQFDLIFSSNTLEHIPNALGFITKASELVKPQGTVIIAVPPIARSRDWMENIANPYHLNIWTPLQWCHVLDLFFKDVQPYWHGFSNKQVSLDFLNTPEQSKITEQDFDFQPVAVNYFNCQPTLTAIFLARHPRTEIELPSRRETISLCRSIFYASITFGSELPTR